MRMLLIICVILASCLSAFSAELRGKVVKVIDGDSIVVLDELDLVKFRVRLDRIDAPERSQPFGREAAAGLRELVLNQTVKVRFTKIDRYARLTGVIFLNGCEINLLMVQAGLAWHYQYYDSTREYAEAQQQARLRKIGLWQADDPIPPYQWRKKKRR